MRNLPGLAALLAGIAFAGGADAAMTLNPRGTGQLLLFPYYTVQDGQSTLVSIVNTTDRAKLLHLYFREPYNARDVLDTYIYLGPHDTWTANVFARDANGAANLLTDDRSCSSLPANAPTLPDSRRYHAFLPDNYAGQNTDTGPQGANRTREGSFEIFELGQIKAGTPLAAAVTATNGAPTCANVAQADLGAALEAPGGGLYGTFAIVNAAQGTIMAGQATAIDGFSNVSLWSPLAELPRYLMRAQTGADPNVVAALVPIGGELVSVEYLRDRAPDALSALLMTESLYGDFQVDASAGAETEWVVNMPTKHYYVDKNMFDPQSPRTVRAPFTSLFGASPGYSCTAYDVDLYDRDQRAIPIFPEIIGVPPPNHRSLYTLCFSTEVLRFTARAYADPDDEPLPPYSLPPHSAVLGSRASTLIADIDTTGLRNGTGRLQLGANATPTVLPAGIEGPALRGLPVIGFEATRYINGNVVPGVLANYTYASPLRGRAACANASGAEIACP